jgi:hypothetical protein
VTDDTPRDPLAAIYAEHRECGKPKYDACFAHFPSPHCRADGYPWPCDVDRIRTLDATRPSGDPVVTMHTCWDNHEGPDGTHADGSPCLDKATSLFTRPSGDEALRPWSESDTCCPGARVTVHAPICATPSSTPDVEGLP